MRELSIFIDESGDFGPYFQHSPYYLIGMIFHDQSCSIEDSLSSLRDNLKNLGLSPNFYIHVGPLIRKEGVFKNIDIKERRKLLCDLFAFFRKSEVLYKTFYVDKKYINNSIDMTVSLSRQIASFVDSNTDYFKQFDRVVIYYDNGQTEVTKIIVSVFEALIRGVKYKKPTPGKYKLFQSADLVCSLELMGLKMKNSNLSKTELRFFRDKRSFKNNYLKPMKHKEFN